MANITLFEGGKVALPSAKNMASALRGAAADASGGGQLPEGGVYVNFSGKMGKYSIGQEQEDADPNEVWLVNVFSFEAGWICWKGGNPVAKRLGSIYEPPVPMPDVSEHGPFDPNRGEGWFKAKAFMMRSLDNGRQGYFATNTKSAVREFAKLEGEIARRLEESLPAWPIISLHKEQFTAQGQKNWKPVLEVVGWLGMKQVNKMAEMTSIEEIANSVDDLIAEAENDEANGIEDTTMTGGIDDDADSDNVQHDDDGIEDADVIPDEEEEEQEPEPAPAPRRRRAAAAAPADAPAPRRRRSL